jgi:hypothetical protein
MSSINDILTSLPEEQRKQLLYANEHGFTQVVTNGDTFIGVNCSQLRNIEIIETHNNWCIGRIKRG